MAVQTYPGKMRNGQHRCAGAFKDGYVLRKVMFIDGDIVVYGVFDDEVYRCNAGVGDFMAKSISCLRSAQSGKLIVVLGGFVPNTESGQRSHFVSTDYVIAEEITHEEYLDGKR